MKPITFKQQNSTFAKHQKEYLPLPAFKHPNGQVVSRWKLNWKERIMIILTGKVWLIISTFNNPLQPQLPCVEDPFKKFDFLKGE
jgi:hypothetical protein